jgi:hypothetical protein
VVSWVFQVMSAARYSVRQGTPGRSSSFAPCPWVGQCLGEFAGVHYYSVMCTISQFFGLRHQLDRTYLESWVGVSGVFDTAVRFQRRRQSRGKLSLLSDGGPSLSQTLNES